MYICKDCFLDEELRSEINANAVINGVCDVCGKEGKLMDFSDFHGFFNALLSLFSLTDNSNKTIVDIIQDEWHIFKDKDVAKILLSDIISTSHLDYSIDTCVDYTNEIQDRVAVWDRLKNSVKENSRFFTNMDEFAQYEYLTAGKKFTYWSKIISLPCYSDWSEKD